MDVYQTIVYDISKMTIGPALSLAMRLKCEGAQNVPSKGGALIVSNHRNPVLDPAALAIKIDRPINFLAASVFFTLPLVKQAFRAWGAVPLGLEGGEHSKGGLHTARELLADGELVGIFPEGVHTIAHRRRVHKINTFHTGFARLALECGVPIIPVALIGRGEKTLIHFPPSITRPFFDHPDFSQGAEITYYKRLRIRIGRPLELSGFEGEPVTAGLVSHISGKVRRIITKLYDGEDLERFLTGEAPFDIVCDRV